MSHRVLKSFSCPKPGVAPLTGGAQLQPKDELSPEPGATVDLAHLSDEAIAFLVGEGCITSATLHGDE